MAETFLVKSKITSPERAGYIRDGGNGDSFVYPKMCNSGEPFTVEKREDCERWYTAVGNKDLVDGLDYHESWLEFLKAPKKWEKTYTLESVTDFYADDDFEDALTELFGEDADLSEEVTITLTRKVK